MKQVLTSFVILTITTLSLFSQDVDRSNYQLLWEITGNDFEEPSYLFGSMHLEDKRVFEFCDSMLICMESCEGFSGELNMDSMMMFILEEMFSEDTSNVLKNLLSEEAYDALNNRLLNKEGKSIDELDNKQPWIVEMLLDDDKPENKEGDFEAFLDMYLYNYARKLGKNTYGLEKIEDQLNLSLLKYQTYEEYLIDNTWGESEGEENMEDALEELIQVYRSGDLSAIDKMAIQSMPDDMYKQKLLTDRNVVMADNIGKLGNEMPMFNVVGAAHLPGDDGVIQLLENKGYKLRPISADFTGKAKFKDVSNIELPWHKLDRKEEMECSMEFPAPAVKIKKIEGEDMSAFDFYMTADMFSMEFFMYLGVESPNEIDESLHKPVLDEGMKSMFDDNEEIKIEKIEGPYDIQYQGVSGREVRGTTEEGGEFAGRAFIMGNKFYYLIIMSEDKKLKQADRFFNSLKLFPEKKEEVSGLVILKEYAIAFESPVKLEVSEKKVKELDEDGGIIERKIFMYKGMDERNDVFYSIQMYDMPEGLYLENENPILINTKEKFEELGVTNIKESKKKKYPKINYADYEFIFKGVPTKIGYFMRGSRVYSVIMTGGGNQAGLARAYDKFTSSIKLLDFEETVLIGNKMEKAGVTFELPTKAKVVQETEFEYPFVDYLSSVSSDHNSVSAYVFESMEMSPYYEVKNTDSLLLGFKSALEEDYDEVTFEELKEYKGYPALDVTFVSDSTSVVCEMRMILVDNWLYYMSIYLPRELSRTDYVDTYFNSLNIDASFKRENSVENKTKKILDDITTTDPDVYAVLQDALYEHIYEVEDLPLMYEALRKEIPLDTSSAYYYSLRERLYDEFYNVNDENTINELKSLFNNEDVNLKLAIINIVGTLEGENPSVYWELVNKIDLTDSERTGYMAISHFEDDYKTMRNYVPQMFELSKKKGFEGSVYQLLYYAMGADSLNWEEAYTPYNDEMLSSMKTNFNAWVDGGKKMDSDTVDAMQFLILISGKMPENESFMQYLESCIPQSESYILSQISSELVEAGIPLEMKVWDKLNKDNNLHYVISDLSDDDYKYSHIDLIPKKYRKQSEAARLGMIMTFEYDYALESIELLKVNKIKQNGKSYNQYIYQIEQTDYPDEIILSVCIQPANKKEYALNPIYYDYVVWDKSEEDMDEMLEQLMKYFENE